jgi:hypothetical protein
VLGFVGRDLDDRRCAMGRFVVTYHGSGMPDDPELMEQAKAAFLTWVAQSGDALVDPGAPLLMVTQVADGDATEPVQIGGYSIVQADSLDAVVALLKTHPYVARGGTLQVNQVLEV